ncbi:hypothetical protein XI05_01400 [Bradyrhizobium sp. CCBAU 11357]|nr:hypothetical protein [Bradyrhizobium sp. CCBAU 11357]
MRDKFSGQFHKSIRQSVGIAEDDFDVAPIEDPGLRECVLQRLIDWSQSFSIAKYQPPNPRQRFLRMRDKRPCCRRSPKKRDEIAPSQEEYLIDV